MVSWMDHIRGRICNYYILSPLSTLSADSQHSTATDSLILHASEWPSDLHEEIYVFENGRWSKNAKLFQSVQASTWDDVILDPAMKATLIRDVESFFNNRGPLRDPSGPLETRAAHARPTRLRQNHLYQGSDAQPRLAPRPRCQPIRQIPRCL
ncbi:hypothetical protein MBLNU230_g4309t1 [Neophaeotheca triangularis]